MVKMIFCDKIRNMIRFDKFTLDNGLEVIVHQDKTTPIATFNLLYKVGSRNENPERTGFAHLFEHLMFEGSKNISDYDTPLQKAGGENNAFTTPDFTTYYITVPKENLEVAFWLESDRMLELDFSQEKLDIQKKVVIEEYNQRYLNKPYGDWMLIMRDLAYKKHPYRWATIGKSTQHIADASLGEVKDFFFSYYAPNNAILSISGDVETEQIKSLAQKWFGPIPRRNVPTPNIPAEPQQTELRQLTIERNVPDNAIYKAYHMDHRLSSNYYTANLITDLLANGESSRLFQHLVKEQKTFASVNACISGSLDPGLLFVFGKIADGVSLEQADKCICDEIKNIYDNQITESELTKLKNNIEMRKIVSEVNGLNKAINLAICEMYGDAEIINTDIVRYNQISADDIAKTARSLFVPCNCSTLIYKSAQKTL